MKWSWFYNDHLLQGIPAPKGDKGEKGIDGRQGFPGDDVRHMFYTLEHG